jgi:hypothetical protein
MSRSGPAPPLLTVHCQRLQQALSNVHIHPATAADREWSDSVGALLTAAADLEGDAASRLQAVVLGSSDGSYIIGLEALRDDGQPVDVTPSQVCIMAMDVPQ